MKKIFFFITLLLVMHTCFSQQTEPAPVLTKQDYLHKSRSQKTTALILLPAGAAMVVGGIAINLGDGLFSSTPNKGLWLSYLGGGVMLSSIPFFIAAGKNKKKAMNLSASISTLPVYTITKNEVTTKPSPAVVIRLSL